MSEIICKSNYTGPILSHYTYQVEKDVIDGKINIILYDTRKGDKKKVSQLQYNDIGEEYSSNFLSWYNLFFCSNNYGSTTDHAYMNYAVQRGLKTAATIYIEPRSKEGKAFIRNMPKDCKAVPYGPSMIFAFHEGKLSDFFDLNKIKEIYEKHGITEIDWNKVFYYSEQPMEFFANENVCGFSLQSGGDKEINIVNGLILGYPVESTIAKLKKRYL